MTDFDLEMDEITPIQSNFRIPNEREEEGGLGGDRREGISHISPLSAGKREISRNNSSEKRST